MQSYRVFFGLASFLLRVLVPLILEPITHSLSFVGLCSASFLSYVLHALACACEGDVHRCEVF